MNNIPSIVLDFEQKQALFESKMSKTKTQLHGADINDALIGLGSAGFFDTGLLPVGEGSGLLALRGGFGHLQIVYQVGPGIHQVIWGRSEGDQSAGYWQLAQPYRIWVADFFKGNISGARHFYSLTPVYDETTPLFHVNLPNTNCKGYSGTGVGWMCLYHHDDTSNYNVKQLIEYAFQRASGGEAYNDANMSNTDGPRYYAAKGAPKYFTDPAAWQKKSQQDGWEWTLDDELLQPIFVEGPDSQEKHGGHHRLTIDDVMNGTYYSSYPHKKIDVYPLKPIAALKRGVLADKYPDLVADFVRQSIQRIAKPLTGSLAAKFDTNMERIAAALVGYQVSVRPPVPHVDCHVCKSNVPEDTVTMVVVDFPTNLEALTEVQQVPVCGACESKVVEARIDFLYSRGPDHNGPSIEPVKTLIHLTTVYDGFPRFVSANPDLLVSCPSCDNKYPMYMDDWSIDVSVWAYNNETKTEFLAGCTTCTPHFYCTISQKNISEHHKIVVDMMNYHLDPPQPYQTDVADYLVMGENSPFKICACGIASNIQLHSQELQHEGSPVCTGCVVNGEYHSALAEFIANNYAAAPQQDVPVFITPSDDYDDDDGHYFAGDEDEFVDEDGVVWN